MLPTVLILLTIPLMGFTYRDLEAWQCGMSLVERCYSVTADLPRMEANGLAGQIRRAAVSIPANIAEGHCRQSTRAYTFHVSVALGSHAELETCLELAMRLKMLQARQHDDVKPLLTSVGKLLNRLHQALKCRLSQ